MENEEKDIDLIESFLKGELTQAEAADFERRRMSDPLFAQEVEDYALIMKEIGASQQHAFLDKLTTWEKEIEAKERSIKVIPMRRILSIAASLTVLAVVTFIILNRLSGKDHEQLFITYFQPYKDVISERSGGFGSLQAGMSLYNSGKYAEAVPHLEKQLIEKPGDVAAACYLGISYLASNNISKAKQTFEKLTREDTGLYKEIAQWNLVLIHLKANENELFERGLKEIMNQKNHVYATEAASLSKQL